MRAPEPVNLPEGIPEWAGDGFLLVAGSTHSGEEEIVIEAVERQKDNNMLVAFVPRHPERFDEVGRLLDEKGLPFTRFSRILDVDSVKEKILLVDAMGVLDGFYALADAAFVGGSLVPVGGHNLLEPAWHGVPVLTGPYLNNFRDIAKALVESGGCFICEDGESLANYLTILKSDRNRLTAAGEAARSVSRTNKGACRKNLTWILSLLEDR